MESSPSVGICGPKGGGEVYPLSSLELHPPGPFNYQFDHWITIWKTNPVHRGSSLWPEKKWSGWWFGTWISFSIIYGIILLIDELHHFSRWLLHHQPVMRSFYVKRPTPEWEFFVGGHPGTGWQSSWGGHGVLIFIASSSHEHTDMSFFDA